MARLTQISREYKENIFYAENSKRFAVLRAKYTARQSAPPHPASLVFLCLENMFTNATFVRVVFWRNAT